MKTHYEGMLIRLRAMHGSEVVGGNEELRDMSDEETASNLLGAKQKLRTTAGRRGLQRKRLKEKGRLQSWLQLT